MREQKLELPLARLAGDAPQEPRQRPDIAAGLGHHLDGEGVGLRLVAARIAVRQQELRSDHQRARTGEVAEQRADEERDAAGMDDGAHRVAMGDMAHLVRQNAGDLVGRLRLLDQCAHEDDAPARQREGVLHGRIDHLHLDRARQCRMARQPIGQSRESALARPVALRTTDLSAAELADRLGLDGAAERGLRAPGHQWREPRRQRRQSIGNGRHHRGDGGEGPEQDSPPHGAALARRAAERGAARLQRGGEGHVGDLQHLAGARAALLAVEAQRLRALLLEADRAVVPEEHRTTIDGERQAARIEHQRRLPRQRTQAVEIGGRDRRRLHQTPPKSSASAKPSPVAASSLTERLSTSSRWSSPCTVRVPASSCQNGRFMNSSLSTPSIRTPPR